MLLALILLLSDPSPSFMANNQGPLPKDYSILIDHNFDRLNNRRQFDAKTLLDNNLDWYLLEYLEEMQLSGSCHEHTLNALLSLIGGLSNGSFCRNLLTHSPVWLNIFSHVLGGTGESRSWFDSNSRKTILSERFINVLCHCCVCQRTRREKGYIHGKCPTLTLTS